MNIAGALRVPFHFFQYFKNTCKLLFVLCVALLIPGSLTAQAPKLVYRICASTSNNDIILNWNLPADTCGSFIKAEIWGRQDNFSPFSKIGEETNVSSNQYIHVGAKALSSNWSYYIVYQFLCDNSALRSDTAFIDYDQPDDIIIDSVSIDQSTGLYTVGWSASSASDLFGYVVWENNGTNNTPLDTVFTTQYTETGGGGVRGYTLTVLDSCFNQSVITTVHRTVSLKSDFDTCAQMIRLNWTRYVGWTSVGEYRVFYAVNSGAFTMGGSGTFNSFDLNYANPGDTFHIYIQAKHGTKSFTSSSNRITIITPSYKKPSNLYVEYFSVDPLDFTSSNLRWLVDASSDVVMYKIFWGDNPNFLKLLDSIPQDNSVSGITFPIANTRHNINQQIKHYQVQAFDKCRNLLAKSNIANNILLKIQQTGSGNVLHWNLYSNWDAGVSDYEVYKGYDLGTGFTWNLIGTTADSGYTDNELDIIPGNEGICYYIKAIEDDGNIFGVKGESYSNKICIIEDMLLYVPNAVIAKKGHVLFEPKGIYLDYAKSKMTIYDRWGQIVYITADLRRGWNGYCGNEECPDGVFIYLIEAYSLNGKKEILKGNITLLR